MKSPMRKSFIVAIAVLLLLPSAILAHRLDEYLQATILSVDANRLDGSMRLVPGVAVSSVVIASIDTDGDGVISAAEQNAYALNVLQDLSLSMNGRALTPHLVSSEFPSIDEIREGIGEIHIGFIADLPNGDLNRHLVFENRHDSAIAVYLVNTLVPADKNIHLTAQARNENQSLYQLDFVQSGTVQPTTPNFSGFSAAFRLGLRHIAEGTDHLLFLLVLLLPAPLLALRARWSRVNTVRASLLHIVGIVTAFTLGHSLTLALSVFGLVTIPTRPVEVLIAVSILVSAIHAYRPLFPGREAAIAAFFGLIHGLAFASALNALGFTGWYRLVSLLGFNLGIETMQIAVVAATLPSLLLLSRTRAYSILRIAGALFATFTSLCWIAERLFNTRSSIDRVVETCARYCLPFAFALFLVGVISWIGRTFTASSKAIPRTTRKIEVRSSA
jgi:hypothetical protein